MVEAARLNTIYTTKNKLLIVGALLLALAGFTLAVLAAADPETDVTLSGAAVAPGQTAEQIEIVQEYVPGRGVEAFQQAAVGLDLAPGWALTDFVLNNVAIPTDELDITLELNRYVYSPADGKTVEALDAQTNCASALVYQVAVGTETGTRTERWCFEVL